MWAGVGAETPMEFLLYLRVIYTVNSVSRKPGVLVMNFIGE